MFDDYVRFHARSRPDQPAIVTMRDVITFAKFDADVNRAAHMLRDLDVDADDAVAVAISGEYLHWTITLALARRGIASAPGHDVAARWTITDEHVGEAANRIRLSAEIIAAIIGGPPAAPSPTIRPVGSLGRIMRSSGTTGEEKRIGMSWAVIDAGIRNAPIAYGVPDGPWLAGTGSATILGFIVTLAGWANGKPAIFGVSGARWRDVLATLRPGLIALVPDQLRQLIDAVAPSEDVPALGANGSLRIICGGGSVPPGLARRARDVLGCDMRSVYGAVETGAIAVAEAAMLEQVPAAGGFVLPKVMLEIVDDDDQPVPANMLGRIRVRGDRVVEGYLAKGGPTAEKFRDGWFYPGDLGRLRDDGLLLVEGRVDDLMNFAGHKVLPGWIEQAALTCPGVAEAGAFAMTGEDGLEACWIAIVKEADFDQAMLTDVLHRQLAWLQSIRVLFLSALPRNAMGKIERARLRTLCRDATSRQVD